MADQDDGSLRNRRSHSKTRFENTAATPKALRLLSVAVRLAGDGQGKPRLHRVFRVLSASTTGTELLAMKNRSAADHVALSIIDWLTVNARFEKAVDHDPLLANARLAA